MRNAIFRGTCCLITAICFIVSAFVLNTFMFGIAGICFICLSLSYFIPLFIKKDK